MDILKLRKAIESKSFEFRCKTSMPNYMFSLTGIEGNKSELFITLRRFMINNR